MKMFGKNGSFTPDSNFALSQCVTIIAQKSFVL
jgi:hypothetical protein